MSTSGIAARAAALAGGTLIEATRQSGGNLSEVIRLRLADGRALIAKRAGTARAEAAMLGAIAATGAPVPAVVAVEHDLLVMEAVAADGRLAGAAWLDLAHALARLHGSDAYHSGSAPYGWPVDHAFGAVAINNGRSDDWPRFWADRRLRCHLAHVDAGLAHRIERLANRLGDLVPAQPPPALLHGDLWGGNVLVGGERVSALIDPACYYGDREVDVAMLTLFDRPPPHFFEALALRPGWRERLPVYRLWPLLVHLRLFGDGYRKQVEEALARLGA